MRLLQKLEKLGVCVWLDENGKIRYRGRQSSAAVSSLLDELRTRKEEVKRYLRANRMDAAEAIRLAWAGKLKRSVLIEPRAEYRELWGGAVWLCPDDASKARIRQKYPDDFSLSAREFFDICGLVHEQGQESAKSVIECMRLFGGSLIKGDGK